jgi:hypothetical protein
MYEHNISGMATKISDGLDLDKEQEERVREILNAYWSDRIAIPWSLDDVYQAAERMEVPLDSNQAQEVLAKLVKKHDASVGINWDVIESTIMFLDFEG